MCQLSEVLGAAMRLLASILIAWFALTVIASAADGGPLFVFSATSVTASDNPNAKVTLGETLSIPEILSRFSDYKLTLTYECEGTALLIERAPVALCVYFDDASNRVVGASLWGDGAKDQNGAVAGQSVNSADLGAAWTCEIGEHMTCASNSVKGLHYIVDPPESCVIDIPNDSTTFSVKLPDCATVAGFEIWQH